MTFAPPAHVIAAAIEAARMSPCDKSKRGAVIFEPTGAQLRKLLGDRAHLALAEPIVSSGFNGRPGDVAAGSCGGGCRSVCRDVAVHAEVRAIRGSERIPLRGCEIVHAKVVDGELVAGGGPSCVACSKEILDAGLAAVWLYQTNGTDNYWVRYEADVFHGLSLEAHGIPTALGVRSERLDAYVFASAVAQALSLRLSPAELDNFLAALDERLRQSCSERDQVKRVDVIFKIRQVCADTRGRNRAG